MVPLRAARAGIGVIGGTFGVARHPERAKEALRRSRALAEVIVEDELAAAPRTSLNVPIGGKRRMAVAWVPLDELKEIKRSMGGTVNDVVLAVAAAGLRRLLLDRRESLPEQGLRAMVPVNIRAAGEELALGNRITSLFVHLPVGVEDPVERYARQMEEAESLKSGTQALGSSTLIDLTKHAPGATQLPRPLAVRDPIVQPHDHQRARAPVHPLRTGIQDDRYMAGRSAGRGPRRRAGGAEL